MKTSRQLDQTLIELSQLDLLLVRLKSQLLVIEDGVEYRVANQRVVDFGVSLSAKRNEIESLELELERTSADLRLVDDRIARDTALLQQSSSPKDISGIQHELDALLRRKDELETNELEMLEALDLRRTELEALQVEHAQLEQAASKIADELQQNLMKTKSDLQLKQSLRDKLAGQLPAELLSLYQSRQTRGISVGILKGRECGACRINLGATDLEKIGATPIDEVTYCPECQAILVRSQD